MILLPSGCRLSHQPLHKPASDRLIADCQAAAAKKSQGTRHTASFVSPRLGLMNLEPLQLLVATSCLEAYHFIVKWTAVLVASKP